MQNEKCLSPRPPEHVLELYQAWANAVDADGVAHKNRDALWCLYVDARDGLPEGTTQSALEPRDPRQMAMFPSQRRYV